MPEKFASQIESPITSCSYFFLSLFICLLWKRNTFQHVRSPWFAGCKSKYSYPSILLTCSLIARTALSTVSNQGFSKGLPAWSEVARPLLIMQLNGAQSLYRKGWSWFQFSAWSTGCSGNIKDIALKRVPWLLTLTKPVGWHFPYIKTSLH